MDVSIRSSKYLEQLKSYLGVRNFRARWRVVCGVCGLLTFPGYHVRKGFVDINELMAFPADIRRRLVTSTWLTIFASSWLVLAYILLNFTWSR